MNYFKNENNKIFAYDDEQTEQGYGSDLTPITESELAELQKPTQADLDAQKVSEAKAYLASTDFYMTVDKYATLTDERKAELTQLRAEARVLINALEVTDVEG
jgi:hypothetical protein